MPSDCAKSGQKGFMRYAIVQAINEAVPNGVSPKRQGLPPQTAQTLGQVAEIASHSLRRGKCGLPPVVTKPRRYSRPTPELRHSAERLFEMLHSETCQAVYANKSASADGGGHRDSVRNPSVIHLDEAQRVLRRRLRAHARILGDQRQPNGVQSVQHLVWEVASSSGTVCCLPGFSPSVIC